MVCTCIFRYGVCVLGVTDALKQTRVVGERRNQKRMITRQATCSVQICSLGSIPLLHSVKHIDQLLVIERGAVCKINACPPPLSLSPLFFPLPGLKPAAMIRSEYKTPPAFSRLLILNTTPTPCCHNKAIFVPRAKLFAL